MANPLKMLKLKPTTIQSIQEVEVDAAPKKVWASLLKVDKWFVFDPAHAPKHTLDLCPGGLWTSTYKDGTSMLMGTVSYYEPGKLLRIVGQLGMTHLPVTSAVIFELQPKEDGKTLLRVGTRMFGLMLPDAAKGVKGAWTHLIGQLKAAAEK